MLRDGAVHVDVTIAAAGGLQHRCSVDHVSGLSEEMWDWISSSSADAVALALLSDGLCPFCYLVHLDQLADPWWSACRCCGTQFTLRRSPRGSSWWTSVPGPRLADG
jgi:hypothetical protein